MSHLDMTATAQASRTRAVELVDCDVHAQATEAMLAKEVNDTLGHHFGDELLRDLGPRLAEAIGPDGLVARLGGDEFAVLPAESTNDTEELEAIAQRLIRCVHQPVLVDEMTLEVGVSIGVSRFPRDGEDLALAAAQRGRGDVSGEGGARGLQGVRGRARSALGPAPERAERLPARARLG